MENNDLEDTKGIFSVEATIKRHTKTKNIHPKIVNLKDFLLTF